MLIFVILLTVAVLGIWLWNNYLPLSEGQKSIEPAWSGLAAQLKNRYELLPEFASFKGETSKGAALFDTAVELAGRSAGTTQLSDRAKVETEFQNAFAEYLHNIEHFSNLTDKPEYLQVREKLLVLEDAINVSKSNYNDTVAMYNARQKVFPGTLIATKTGMKPGELFDVEDTFARFPLKFKLVMPEKKPSIFMPPPKEK